MRKLFILATVCSLALFAAAQTDVRTATLKHGDQITVFKSVQAFVLAYEAAVDGDIITLSEGTFTQTNIAKSITIYGAGFEENSETSTRISQFSGGFNVAKSGSDTLDGVHIEGVKINGELRFGLTTNCMVRRCQITGQVHFDNTAENPNIEQCYLGGSINGNTKTIHNLRVANCYLNSTAHNFLETESTVLVDHCIIAGSWDYRSANNVINITNSILVSSCSGTYAMISPRNGYLTNCIVRQAIYSPGTVLNNVVVVPLADMFADGVDATYAPERTFVTKQPETWLGTDGTPIGIVGGLSWNKTPAIPAVKNLKLTVDGNQLKVNYETEVR